MAASVVSAPAKSKKEGEVLNKIKNRNMEN